jgi:hypothetical protein
MNTKYLTLALIGFAWFLTGSILTARAQPVPSAHHRHLQPVADVTQAPAPAKVHKARHAKHRAKRGYERYSRSMDYSASAGGGYEASGGLFSTVAGIMTLPIKVATKVCSGAVTFAGSAVSGAAETGGGFADGFASAFTGMGGMDASYETGSAGTFGLK